MLRAAVWPWRSATTQCSTRMFSFGMRIGPARDIAGGVDAGNAGFEIRVHGDAAIERKAGLFGQRQPRPHADADDHHIGLQHAAALERRALAVDPGHGIAEMEDDAVLLMQRAHEVAHLGPEHALHRPLLRRHDMNLEFARAQCGRGLEPDETRADHDDAARAFHRVDDGAAIAERAQRMDMRLIGARDRQPHRLGAGRQQQAVVGDRSAAGEDDVARLGVDRDDIGLEPQVDIELPRKNCPGAAAANPPARCRRDNPSTGSAGRPAARHRCSA